MSAHEKVLRRTGASFPGFSAVAVPMWFVNVPTAIIFTVLASVSLGVVSLWYFAWMVDSYDGRNSAGQRIATYLGAGRTSSGSRSLYMCQPYLVWGKRFQRRIMIRRIRALERATGFDGQSPFTDGFDL